MTDRYEAQVSLTQGMVLKDANGDPEPMKGTDGAGHVVNVGQRTQLHNRSIDNVAESQLKLGHMTWTAEEEVYSVRFKAVLGGGTVASGAVIRVVFDAYPVDDITDDSQAWAWLQDAGDSASLDVEYFEFRYIPVASLVSANSDWSEWYTFSNPLRRADFMYVDGNGATDFVSILSEVG